MLIWVAWGWRRWGGRLGVYYYYYLVVWGGNSLFYGLTSENSASASGGFPWPICWRFSKSSVSQNFCFSNSWPNPFSWAGPLGTWQWKNTWSLVLFRVLVCYSNQNSSLLNSKKFWFNPLKATFVVTFSVFSPLMLLLVIFFLCTFSLKLCKK